MGGTERTGGSGIHLLIQLLPRYIDILSYLILPFNDCLFVINVHLLEMLGVFL